MPTTLRLILVWGIIFVLAFLYLKPIVMCLLLMRKNNAGLATTRELSEIETLLQQHPWKEEQELQVIGETGAPYLCLKGFYTTIFVYVKNHVLTCGSGVVTSLRDGYWEQYEANQLLQYIAILTKDENSPEAIMLSEQSRHMLADKKGRDKMKKWLGRIITFAGLVWIVILLLYAKEKREAPSSLAQNMIFPDFHYTKTVGSALSSFDPDGEWFNISDKNALKDMGVAYAGWRGSCKSSGAFTETENWSLAIYFELTLTDEKDKYTASVDRIEFGEYSLVSSQPYHNGPINEIMNMVYGNQDSVVVWTDAGLLGTTYRLSKKDPVLSSTTEQTPAAEETLVSVPTSVPALTDTYSASAMGFGGNVTVTITVSEGVITSVVINGPDETAGLGSRVIEEMPTQIIAAQSADIDGISGATETSNAVKDALRSCIAQAKGGNASIAGVKDRSEWEYKDYVEYYGFDPANYGYYWYNEIESGPLEDFFEGVAGLVGETSNVSRLFQDTWLTDLTWDDFMGVWRTEGGITFTIDCIGNNGTIEDYTIDFSGNEGLGILGGWFSEDIYNIEGDFCGMSGSNGMSSYSVTYQYSTESSETNTWLFLEFVNSEGNTIQDSIPLVRDGVPCQ